MKKLLTPWELTPLFVEGGYLAGGEMEATFLLLSKSKFVGWLSIFNIYWKRATPGSGKEWLFWTFIAIAGVVATTVIAPSNGLVMGFFLAILLNTLNMVAKCVQQTEAKYNHIIKYCLTVLNSGSKVTWSESDVRCIVSEKPVKI